MQRANSPPQSRRATYVDTVELTDPTTRELLSLVGLTAATASICLPFKDVALVEKTLGAGVTAISPGFLQWRFDVSDLEALAAPGDYRFLLLATVSGDVVELVDEIVSFT